METNLRQLIEEYNKVNRKNAFEDWLYNDQRADVLFYDFKKLYFSLLDAKDMKISRIDLELILLEMERKYFSFE